MNPQETIDKLEGYDVRLNDRQKLVLKYILSDKKPKIQFFDHYKWEDCICPSFNDSYKWREKPKTRNIKVGVFKYCGQSTTNLAFAEKGTADYDRFVSNPVWDFVGLTDGEIKL